MSAAAFLFCTLAALSLAAMGLGLRLLVAEQRLDRRLGQSLAARDLTPAKAWRIPRLIGVGKDDRREIETKLRNAGFRDPRAVEIFALVRLALTALVTFVTGLACALSGDGFFSQPLLLLILGGLTYIGCKLALNLFAARRVRRITAEFPFLLDLMFMMLQSGISLDQCLRTIAVDRSSAVPMLSLEFAQLAADLDRGLSYEVALDRWAANVPVSGSRELAALFRQSLFHGVELIPALREFATEFSGRRLAAAKEAMGQITVRMVILMIVFFMPALFIVLGGPPVAAVFDTLAQGTKQ